MTPEEARKILERWPARKVREAMRTLLEYGDEALERLREERADWFEKGRRSAQVDAEAETQYVKALNEELAAEMQRLTEERDAEKRRADHLADRIKHGESAAEAEVERLREGLRRIAEDSPNWMELDAVNKMSLRHQDEARALLAAADAARVPAGGPNGDAPLLAAVAEVDWIYDEAEQRVTAMEVRAEAAEAESALRLSLMQDLERRGDEYLAELRRLREGLREAVDMIRFPCAECKPFIDKARALLADSPDGAKPRPADDPHSLVAKALLPDGGGAK